MNQNNIKLTVAQFAKLHQVNRRTLHYYDNIGLFSPNTKKENGYRYYDLSQSIDFEYIRMLKELNMTIEEIKEYYENPNSQNFLKIVEEKNKEIELEIQKLTNMKKTMQMKKEQVLFCETLQDQEIRIETLDEKNIYVLPFDFTYNHISHIFSYIKDKWSIEQIRMGIGGMISLDKVITNQFDNYDGLFTQVYEKNTSSKCMTIPKGNYICGYQKGTWDKLPEMYQKMLAHADKNHLKLKGYAYEFGLNEFVISSQDDYMTKIMIQIDENN